MTRKFSDYRIEIRPIPEGGYMASIPQLPGCMADAVSARAAVSQLDFAFDAWTDAARAQGREVPEPDDSAWVPDGWKMVPIEPDDAAMQLAGGKAIRYDTSAINKLWIANAVYRAMIAAAPAPPKGTK